MDAKLQRRVQRYGWDRAASRYENHWSRQLEPAQGRMLELAGLRPGDKVLDVACGTGLVSFPAAEAVGGKGFVVGTDLSENMVKSAEAEAQKRGLANCSFRRMDAETLDYPDEYFDVVLCALGLMYVPDTIAALREMHRVTRSNGRLSVAVWGARKHCGWADIFPIVDARVKTEVCPLFFRLGAGNALDQEAAAAGWNGRHVDRLSTLLNYRDDEDALGGAFVGGPVALAYSRFDEKTRDEAHSEYLESIRPFRDRDSGGYAIPGEFVILSAVC